MSIWYDYIGGSWKFCNEELPPKVLLFRQKEGGGVNDLLLFSTEGAGGRVPAWISCRPITAPWLCKMQNIIYNL